MRDESSSPVLYVKLIYSDETKKILSIFRTKGNKSINPFDYLRNNNMIRFFNIKWKLGKKSEFQMGFEPTTLRDLVGCSNH